MRQALLNNYINHATECLMGAMGNPSNKGAISRYRMMLERAMKAAGFLDGQ